MSSQSQPTCLEVTFKKSLIAFPFLLLVFFAYGVRHEHGDMNAGSMYPLVFAVQYFVLSIVSYVLYFLTDRYTLKTKMNFIKISIHLILGIFIFLFHDKAITIVILLTLPTLLISNVATFFYNSLNEQYKF
jgi:MFS-type transporter involved in bile tolerance (Atg22 family)